jgi:hypothetical protein
LFSQGLRDKSDQGTRIICSQEIDHPACQDAFLFTEKYATFCVIVKSYRRV